MSEIVLPIVYQLGAGGILGFVVGYAVKKMMKIVAVIIGIFALILIYLGHTGIIDVNYDKLSEAIEGLYGGAGEATHWLTPLVANLPFAGVFLVGAAIGFKAG
jgi:uncharacterized membrane protein (Fun14 family)